MTSAVLILDLTGKSSESMVSVSTGLAVNWGGDFSCCCFCCVFFFGIYLPREGAGTTVNVSVA